MLDFERNHRLRRAVTRALEQSQKSESLAAERSRQLAVRCKQELLLLFSRWLLALDAAGAVSEAERREVQALTRAPLGIWIQLQSAAAQIAKELNEAERKEKEAIAALQRKAPFGTATKVFADTESKMQIRELQNAAAAAQKHSENTAARLRQNAADRRTLGEVFLRDCLEHCNALASTKTFGREAQAILSHLSQETNALWVHYARQHLDEMDQLAALIAALRESCKPAPGTAPESNKYDLTEG